jgi:hypothetical protein
MAPVDELGHFEDPPRLRDEWEDDTALRGYLARVLPADVIEEVTPSLAEMGALAAGELYELHCDLDRRETNPGTSPTTRGDGGLTGSRPHRPGSGSPTSPPEPESSPLATRAPTVSTPASTRWLSRTCSSPPGGSTAARSR